MKKPADSSIPERGRNRRGDSKIKNLKDLLARFPRADAQRAFHRQDENLAVADLARAALFGDDADRFVDQLVGHDDFEFPLGNEIRVVLAAAVKFGGALLASEFLDL